MLALIRRVLWRLFSSRPSAAPVDPVIQAIHSRRAWARFQANVRRERDGRRAKHQSTRDIDQRQQDTVHAALRANRH